MRKLFSIWMTLIAVVTILSGYVAQTSGAPAETKPIELKLATVAPPVGATGEELKWFASEVAKRTNGAVTIRIAWAGSLAGPKEMPEAVRTGAIDIAHLPWAAFAPSLVPLHTITEKCAAFRGGKPLALQLAGVQLHKEFPEFDAEYAMNNMKRISYRGQGGMHVESKKPIRTLEDLKGLKISATGLLNQTLLRAVGAVPVFMMIDQVADNMQKGVIDGDMQCAAVSVRFKIYEAVKYFNRFAEPALGQDAGFSNTINLDTWNKLPADTQKIFLDLCEEYPFKYAEFDQKDNEAAYKTIQNAGVQIIDVPASETERWKSLISIQNINEEWVKFAMQNTKVPEKRLREILARYIQLLDEMAKKYPQSW
jgi:TRAP-type C4-dicarboxylate transport system substrate-binding protein